MDPSSSSNLGPIVRAFVQRLATLEASITGALAESPINLKSLADLGDAIDDYAHQLTTVSTSLP